MRRNFVVCEFGSDHVTNEDLGRILLDSPHLIHPFEILMKMSLSAW